MIVLPDSLAVFIQPPRVTGPFMPIDLFVWFAVSDTVTPVPTFVRSNRMVVVVFVIRRQ